MNDLDKMARELLGSEWRKLTDHEGAAEELESGCELPPIVSASVAAIRAAGVCVGAGGSDPRVP